MSKPEVSVHATTDDYAEASSIAGRKFLAGERASVIEVRHSEFIIGWQIRSANRYAVITEK